MFVVAGVSGNTGSVVANTLLSQGKAVRVIVRDAAKGAPWKARGAEVAVAELGDATALAKALTGAEGAYLLLPPNYASTSNLADNAKIAGAIVEAVDKSGVGHVVFLSSIGAHEAAGTGPIRALHDVEARLAASRAKVTLLRAAYFMENWGMSLAGLEQGALSTFLRADRAIPMVATTDIGTEAARALLEGGSGHTVIELGGPKDYAPTDVAATLSTLVGKPVTVQEGPESAIVPALTSMGLTPDLAELYREMNHGVNVGTVAWQGGAARSVRGKTGIDTVLRNLTAKKSA